MVCRPEIVMPSPSWLSFAIIKKQGTAKDCFLDGFLLMKQRRLKLVIEVMATNLRDRIDEAIQSRVGESVQFSYPTFAQCKEHFAANASLVS